MEVTAGIGSFSGAAKPSFLIDNKTVSPNEDAIAVYRLKVEGKGEKSIPIRILFVGPDGQKRSTEMILKYYVDE